jgi:hypothetical protein
MNKNSLASVASFCMTLGYEVKIVDMVFEFSSSKEYLSTAISRNKLRL